MTHAHSHESGGYRSAAQRNSGRLLLVLLLTLGFAIVEVAGGLLTNSLALLADAGHMFTDALGLAMALGAAWLAGRPATDARSFGYYRIEIVAALFNGILLLGVAGYVLVEAVRRFTGPPDVEAGPMIAVAAAGLVVNFIGLRLLAAGSSESLNIRGAYLEVLADLLGSAAAVAAGVILITTGWGYADPLFGAGIGLMILPRTVHLMRGALSVLLESTPSHIDAAAVEQAMRELPLVEDVHDLHIWQITSGMDVLSCHVTVGDPGCGQQCLAAVGELLRARFGIEHMTVQVEGPGFDEAGPHF